VYIVQSKINEFLTILLLLFLNLHFIEKRNCMSKCKKRKVLDRFSKKKTLKEGGGDKVNGYPIQMIPMM